MERRVKRRDHEDATSYGDFGVQPEEGGGKELARPAGAGLSAGRGLEAGDS